MTDTTQPGADNALDLDELQPAAFKSTQEARAYLIEFMMQHFSDKTFHRYIRGEGRTNFLAGDFAWQMATALRKIDLIALARRAAQPVEAPAEHRNITRMERLGDQSIGITFASARSCSAFSRSLEAATHPSEPVAPQGAFNEQIFRTMVAIWAHNFPDWSTDDAVAARRDKQWRAVIDYIGKTCVAPAAVSPQAHMLKP